MSWMDSWSRPSKSQATPAPFYLLPGGENTPYCKSCGRVISSRKSGAAKKKSNLTPVKYCSSRCHGRKVGPVDQKIEDAFVAFLNGAKSSSSSSKSGDETTTTGHARGKNSISKTKAKGDARILVSCRAIEEEVFGPRRGAEKGDRNEQDRSETAQEGEKDVEGRRPKHESGSGDMQFANPTTNSENSASIESENGSTQQEEMETIDPGVLARMSIRSGTRRRPPQNISEVNGSVGGEKGRAERIDEDEEMRAKRLEGERRTEEREQVRRAARRGVVFGFLVGENGGGGQAGERRKCEAVMQGKVVEPSFAKGEWGIRWRE